MCGCSNYIWRRRREQQHPGIPCGRGGVTHVRHRHVTARRRKAHTHTHTHDFIRLFYYTPMIKQFNEIIIICVWFPGGGGGGGGSVEIFFYKNFSKLSLCHRYNGKTSVFLLFIGIWSNVIDRTPPWKSVTKLSHFPFHRNAMMISTDKLFVSLCINNNLLWQVRA